MASHPILGRMTSSLSSSGGNHAIVIVESCFGSTRAVAEQIAQGLHEGGVAAQVLSPEQATADRIADAWLLALGAPTHNRGLPTATSRAQAGNGDTMGLREWLAAAQIAADVRLAAFDTVIRRSWLSGSAAKRIARALRRPKISVHSCVVTGSRGPLADGQAQAARDWGTQLAR